MKERILMAYSEVQDVKKENMFARFLKGSSIKKKIVFHLKRLKTILRIIFNFFFASTPQ